MSTKYPDLDPDHLLEPDTEPTWPLRPISRPLLPVRDTVLFPYMMTTLLVGRHASLRAVDEAMQNDQSIVVVAQRDVELEDPKPDDLYTVGTETIIGRVLRMPDGTSQLLVQGQRRVRILGYEHSRPFLQVQVLPIVEPSASGLPVEALSRAVLVMFEKCVQLNPNLLPALWLAQAFLSIVHC